eukprot:8847808-Alexandrium_andersonii.AAC.1
MPSPPAATTCVRHAEGHVLIVPGLGSRALLCALDSHNRFVRQGPDSTAPVLHVDAAVLGC